MNGKPINLDQRAEATAEYLQEKQWGATQNNIVTQNTQRLTREFISKHLKSQQRECADNAIDDDEITRDELNRAITKMKRHKSPGPDQITTDWLKDLNSDNREK